MTFKIYLNRKKRSVENEYDSIKTKLMIKIKDEIRF